MGVINFPGVDNHKPDPFMEGYWEGLGEGFKLGDADRRRGNLIGVAFGALSGGIVGAGIVLLVNILL